MDKQTIVEIAKDIKEEKYAIIKLTDEEYELWQGRTLNIKNVRKETAEKFAEMLKEMHEYDERLCDIADKICKEIIGE